ncbi:MAG: hypothetical protein EB060_10670 [Proteobacteria bacterium]|nr:hypothetical protein [Pseudomonadota bacterium]
MEDMEPDEIPSEYIGWWKITETSQWSNKSLDAIGPAPFSISEGSNRLRMHYLLAHVTFAPAKAGLSFTWQGAWEFDPLSGSGRVTLDKDGRLKGQIKINQGDQSTFIAERSDAPKELSPDPPRYQDKWQRRRW